MLPSYVRVTASGTVALYHVEDLTPDAKEKGRDLLEEGYQTYVFDDAEQERVRSTFPTEFKDRPKKPTHCYIGCPHITYHEILTWGKAFTESLEKKKQEKGAISCILFTPNPVRDRLVEDEPLLVGKMKSAGIRFSNMCQLSYSGMKGVSERVYAVTNSPKTRNYYSNVHYLRDESLAVSRPVGCQRGGARRGLASFESQEF